MKKQGVLFISLLIILGGLFYGTPLFTKNSTSDAAIVLDLLNPFVKQSEVYVKTTENYVSTYNSQGEEATNYVYETTSYSRKGKKRHLKYVSFGKKLTPNKYLKLTIKGQDVRKWEEVSPKEVPEKSLQKLN